MRVMRAVFLLFIFGGLNLSTGSFPPPSPVNVTFSSVNLRNVLKWDPGHETPADTRYSVEFAFYGDNVGGNQGNWRPVQRCRQTEMTQCDLTRETWDAEHSYYGRVRAVGSAPSKWIRTRMRFVPKVDTTFGKPQISVEVKDKHAIVYLSGPIRYQADHHAPPISMALLYPQMHYNISVFNSRQKRVHHFPVTSSPFKYELLDFETEYCFSAKARFISLDFKCHQSEMLCITTGKDPIPVQVQMAIFGIVVPSLCMCIFLVVGYILYHYLMGNGRKNPITLDVAPLRLQLNETLLRDPITHVKPPCYSDNDDDDNNASDCAHSSAVQPQEPPPVPEEHSDDSLSYGEVGVAMANVEGQCDAHPEEFGLETATLSATQWYLPQEENVTQSQTDFPTMYLANTASNDLRMPVTEMTVNPYRPRGEAMQGVLPTFTPYTVTSNITAENYSVLVSTGAGQDEEGAPLCAECDPQMVLNQGEGEGRGKKVAKQDLRLERVFVKEASQEMEAPPQGAAASCEVDDMARKWGLVFKDNE
ncbi:interleukin-20 receptor subunit alpha [Vanacampus margaritifer]